ncbi:MAG: T4 family baseplate hub assembly chaperone, partial [Armatimonadota bacterium]
VRDDSTGSPLGLLTRGLSRMRGNSQVRFLWGDGEVTLCPYQTVGGHMYTFTLPSGVEIELKEMTGMEEELLTNQRLIRSGDAVNQVLRNCILRIGDKTEPDMSDITSMLSGDRLFTLVRLRQISLGDEVELELTCSNQSCRAKNHAVVNLNDLPVTPYGESQEFIYTLPGSGQKVRFCYLDGSMEKRLSQMQEPTISSAMMIRILDIDGSAPSKKMLAEMSMRDRSALRSEMVSLDAGIDTSVIISCDSCGMEIRTRLEAEASFLFPGVR